MFSRRFGRALPGLLLSLVAGSAGCVSLPFRPPAQHTGSPAELMSRGAEAERRESWDQARWAYQHAVRQDPGLITGWHRLAVVCTRQNDHRYAADCFNMALRQAPHNADLLTDAGYSCYLRGETAAAQKLLVLALNADPAHRRATNNLGVVLANSGRMSESLAMFERIHPRPVAYKYVGQLYQQAGDMSQAKRCYDYALRLSPQIDVPHLSLSPMPVAELADAASVGATSQQSPTSPLTTEDVAPPTAAPELIPLPPVDVREPTQWRVSRAVVETTVTPSRTSEIGHPRADVEPASFTTPVADILESLPAGAAAGASSATENLGGESPGWLPRVPTVDDGATSSSVPPASPQREETGKTWSGSSRQPPRDDSTPPSEAPARTSTDVRHPQTTELAEVHAGWSLSPGDDQQNWGMTISAAFPADAKKVVTPASAESAPESARAPVELRMIPTQTQATTVFETDTPAARVATVAEKRTESVGWRASLLGTPSKPTVCNVARASTRETRQHEVIALVPSTLITELKSSPLPEPAPEPSSDTQPGMANPLEEIELIAFDQVIHLADICLVSLTDEQTLAPVRKTCQVSCRGEAFFFSSDSAVKKFRANPHRYLPAAGGLDVVNIHRGKTVHTGELSHAAWFRHRLYLFTSADHLQEFCRCPSRYFCPDIGEVTIDS